MIAVGVSGAAGRMGRLVAATVADQPDLELHAAYDPHHAGESITGVVIGGEPAVLDGSDVIVEFTEPGVVMENIAHWRALGAHAVVGTSGFDAARLAAVRELWPSAPPNCLIVPNFSIGAVAMMRLAELVAPHFAAAEIVEMHHDRKVDAPSGTALATAERIAGVASQHRAVESRELVAGARGADVSGVHVHALRLPGLVAHQLVVFGNPGETLTIRHDMPDRVALLPGVLLAIRSVATLEAPVSVGIERLLGI